MKKEINPFVFGKAAEEAYFTDRKKETSKLLANLTHGINTVLISPRRWGKTSLVKKVIRSNNRSDVMFVYIDIFACKSEQEFFSLYATEIIRQTSSKIEEWVDMAKNFLSNITPKFSFGSDPINDFSLSFEWDPKLGCEKDILQLPERIAQKKDLQIVVCIDEFQEIEFFEDALNFQKKLRSVWQYQQNTTYCLFGSKKHLMTKIFSAAECPFYKFGDIMFLNKIPTSEWVEYIKLKFEQTGKHISDSQAEKICFYSENLSSYVQQLSWTVWYLATDTVEDEMIEGAVDMLLEQMRLLYQRDVESLTALQLNFLKAVASGVQKGFSKKEIRTKFNLESSANIQVVRKALIAKEIIDIDDNGAYICDPLFRLWLSRWVR